MKRKKEDAKESKERTCKERKKKKKTKTERKRKKEL